MALVSTRLSQSDLLDGWTDGQLSPRAKLPLPKAPDFMQLFKSYHAVVSQQKTALEKYNHKDSLRDLSRSFAQLRHYETKIEGRIYKRLRREQCLTLKGVEFIHTQVINYTNWQEYFDCWDAKDRRTWLKEQFDKYYEGDLKDVWVEDMTKPKPYVLKCWDTDDEDDYKVVGEDVHSRFERAMSEATS